MKKKVSDIIADFLVEKNVSHVFGIIGSGNAHIFDSIYHAGKTEIVCVHHEQAAVMAAGTYFRSNQIISSALVTTGAGSTNAVTGVVSCWMDSIPCLIISGNENSKFTRDDNHLRIWGIQGYASPEMVSRVTKYSARVMKPEDILFELQKAHFIAGSGRPGPVWLDVPMNVQSTVVETDDLRQFTPEIPKYPAIGADKMTQVIQSLARAKRPLLWLGHGIRLAGHHTKLEKFLEQVQIPALVSWAGIDMLPADHPLVVGRAGLYGQRAANFILQNCDYLLTIGTRLAMPQIGYEVSELAREAKIAVVDIDALELEKYAARYESVFHSDAGAFMNRLTETLKGEGLRAPDEWMEKIKEYKRDYPTIGPEHADRNGFINSYPFMDRLSELIPDGTTVVTDMGTALLSGHQVLRLKSGQRLMTSTGLGEMGYGLPAAIGAAFGNSGKPVLCLNCDGGMMMNLQELQTIDQHRLPIKIVVFNNDGYLMIKHTQKALFKGRFSGTDKKSGVTCPDFQKVAGAFNLSYHQVKTWDDFAQHMSKFLNEEGPSLCEVYMDPEQPLVPKLSLAIKEDGTLVSPPLEDLSPLVSRESLKKAMLIPIHPKSADLK